MTRIALLFPIVLFAVLSSPLDGSAEGASRGSLTWLAVVLGDRGSPPVDPSTDGGPAAPGTATSEAMPSASTTAGDGRVALEIVMPADVPRPGDEGCDPSYPQLCIPLDAPDVDCREMGVARFKVLAPDRHLLDEDGDGLGCED